MAIESALVKPVVDAIMALLRRGENLQLNRNAEKAVREAIRELLLANPDENKAAVRIAVARAAGLLSEDVMLAEAMLQQHRATKAKTRGKALAGHRQAAARPAAKPPAPTPRGKPPPSEARPAAKPGRPRPPVKTSNAATLKPAARRKRVSAKAAGSRRSDDTD